MTFKVAYSLVSAIAILLWTGALVRDWGARTYARLGEDSLAWFWMRQFDVPVNEPNCVTFMKMASVAGISFLMVTNIAVWVV